MTKNHHHHPSLLLLSINIVNIHMKQASILLRKQSQHDRKQPPGPPALPILGHLHLLGNLPHRTLQTLSKRYGPIMSLRLGQVPISVVTSPEAAEQFLKTHESVFASRIKIEASKYLSYDYKGLVFSQYGHRCSEEECHQRKKVKKNVMLMLGRLWRS
ncbi:Cytochrome P450 [Sesbania bispinosa]|nr:Cytochrome P450 [Sesbania bispinosa]